MSDERDLAVAEEATGTRMNMIQAINSAMDVMMERDPNVIVLGEDVGFFGGVFRATAGLQKKYGKTRVFDTPITECGIIGVAVGMGAYGPVSYTHLDVYKRQPQRRVRWVRARSSVRVLSPTAMRRVDPASRWRRAGSVSYTHLDVYKRQSVGVCPAFISRDAACNRSLRVRRP